MNISVLGAGHGGHAMSADLSLAGHNVNLFEFEEFEENIRPIREKGGIEIIGTLGCRSGFARLDKLTTDMKEAVVGTKLVMIVVPGYARDKIFEGLAPHLTDGQVLVNWPSYWSALVLHNKLEKTPRKTEPTISEAVSLIYACRRIGPAVVWVRRVKEVMPIAALPSNKTWEVIEVLKEVYPQVVPATSVLETSLSNPNPLSHVPGMLLNAARIEATKGDFNFFQEVQLNPLPCIRKVKSAIEAEREEVGKRLGVRTDWSKEFYLPGKIATTPEQVSMHGLPFVEQATPNKAPHTLKFRYLTEDVPYGLVPMLSLGEQIGVKLSTTRALVKLASIINETNYSSQGLTVEKLGLGGLGLSEIERLVKG